jgi:hypothetical protein
MCRMRMILGHWRPFWSYWFGRSSGNWARAATWPVLAMIFISAWLGDPSWVYLVLWVAYAALYITGLCLAAAAYRRSLTGPPDQQKTYTRDDIWKGRWPW